mmetsp:Transcript_22072/g.22260  ORF Transcript_22072/g.22260 Transcript_22072/m.22260 type:complete len:91 (+) Transcript_22072:730-1002(+)
MLLFTPLCAGRRSDVIGRYFGRCTDQLISQRIHAIDCEARSQRRWMGATGGFAALSKTVKKRCDAPALCGGDGLTFLSIPVIPRRLQPNR